MIKIMFRAWDEETSKMYKDDKAIVTFSGKLEEVYVKRNNMIDELINYKLMQYTGMKDADDIRIYEGDIIRVHERMAGDDFIGKVIYEEGCYWIMEGNERNHCKVTFDLEDYTHEVIGNIYENGDLLDE